MTDLQRSPALVITGMHRSGTSLLAATVRAAGLFIGERLVPAIPSNPEGHFEDLEFHLLARAILGDSDYPDHGLVSDVRISVSPARRAEAERLIARRRTMAKPWAWKDPRSVLLLDFWAEMLPEASFCFIVRAPWQVVDSLFRRGDPSCRDDPMLPLRAWVHYNRSILEFIRAKPSRCMVFETERFADEPDRCIRTIADRLGVSLSVGEATFRRELLSRSVDETRMALTHALSPDSTRLFETLCRLAGSEVGMPSRHDRHGLRLVLEQSLEVWSRSFESPVGSSHA